MNFLRTTLHLCLGFASYRDIRDISPTASLKHVAKLILLLTTILTICFLAETIQLLNIVTDWTQRNVPSFRIHNGAVVVPPTVTQPYRAGDRDFLFLLDTTGKTTAADPQSATGILVTADTLTFWMKSAAPGDNAPVYAQRRSLRDFPDTDITALYIRRLLQTFLFVAVILTPLIAFCLVCTQALFFSLAGSLLERGIPGGLRWPQLLNIALHAVTPAAILVAAYLLMGLHQLNLQLIYLIAYGVFLLGASNACRNRVQPEPTSDTDWL